MTEDEGVMRGRFHPSDTELYMETANTLDRIAEYIKTDATKKPLRALIFVVYDIDQDVVLFQSGMINDVLGLASTAADQAIQTAERFEEDEGAE